MKNLNPLDTNPCLNSAFNFTPDDISGDVERLITKTILPYVDPTHPFLQQDELQAECRFKLARIISDGRLVRCPTRAKAFAFIKTAFKNHVCSLVQKYAFTAKRGGVIAPRRNSHSRFEWNCKQSRKAWHVSIDDPDAPVPIGIHDGNLDQLWFLEELVWRLSPLERAVADHLMRHGGGEWDAEETATAAFRAAHSLSNKGFEHAVARIRNECRQILAQRG